MQIRDVAAASGLPAKTIRYYEDIGLIHPERGDNGYRSFGDDDLGALIFIARARGLGFSTADCARLLELRGDPGRVSADVRSLAGAALTRIDTKLAELEAMRRQLSTLVADCNGDAGPDCAILDGLTDGLVHPDRS
ncbi:MerR family transcriptional regulator [Pseudooceanicola algae]|uniref:HTH-type transcriptional regulator CueR n=1 Tax=Pseudooceanicola algae TaxID=1537215 RepID=A0A418SEQ1_9RHOB|nr:MerR family transcriptional regulator [Pseudooceanicola algae]QPM89805.1 HTH-type transcriptional regulator CueR [Pseudooceanicola algae]